MELERIEKNGVVYYRMYIACPVCLAHGRPAEHTYWTHTSCGGKMFIGDNGYYYCNNCEHTNPIIDWMYECEDCQNAGLGKNVKLDPKDLKHIAEAISISGQIAGQGELAWFHKLTAALMKQTGSGV